MQKDSPSTPTAVTTQGSHPVLDGLCPSSPIQIPPTAIFSNPSAAPSQPTIYPSSFSIEPTIYPNSSASPAQATSKQMASSPFSDQLVPLSLPASSKQETAYNKSSSSPPNKAALNSPPNSLTFQNSKSSLFSKLTSAPSTSSSPTCKTSADSPPVSSSTSFTKSPESAIPVKRTFASMAKKVILQERLRKAEEEDANDDEDGKAFMLFNSL